VELSCKPFVQLDKDFHPGLTDFGLAAYKKDLKKIAVKLKLELLFPQKKIGTFGSHRANLQVYFIRETWLEP
jgi:hypothetical protein